VLLLQRSITDIIPLTLLVVFFGIQQRTRKQAYYRFWFIGWMCVLLSYMAWGAEQHGILLGGALEMARLDVLLVASMLFMCSFLSSIPGLRRVVLGGLPVGLLVMAFLNLQQQHYAVPRSALMLAVLAWQGYGIYAAKQLLAADQSRERWLIIALCAVWAVAVCVNTALNGAPDLSQWGQTEIFLSSAVLFGVAHRRNTPAGVLATVGFLLWAVFYGWAAWAPYLPAAYLLQMYWNLPKYLVAFSMVLKISEDAQEEKSTMAEQYSAMYQDFRLVFDNNPHPALIYAEQTGKFLLANQAAVQCYGYSEQEFLERRIGDFVLPGNDEYETVEAQLPPMSDGYRTRVRHRDGHTLWVSITGHGIRYQELDAQLVIVRDVTQRVHIDLEMLRRANHDALTGLPNRRLLEDRLQQALARSVREANKIAVFAIDIDHFKRVNDTYGHHVGDACLRAVAGRLNSKIRSVDTLARIGGEEFVAVIGGLTNAADAEKIARDLLRLFELPLQLPECELPLTVSIGVVVYPDDGCDAATLYKLADQALYAAKRNGRNRAEFAWAARANA
jgi:diguanylate cyclase (GGDEF)-like protein/PAS domain S-box-containing protein